MMTDREMLGRILEAYQSAGTQEFREMGAKLGRLYTDHGLPLDIALGELKKKQPELTENNLIVILDEALSWLVEHRRQSGAPEKALDRQRKTNKETMRSFLTKGEVGLY